MNKLIKFLLVLLLLVAGVSAEAQIRQTIMGVTLGSSSKNSVFTKISNQGYAFSEQPHSLTVHRAEYASYRWNTIQFCYYNNILYKVVFSDPCVPSEADIIFQPRPTSPSTIFSNLKTSLSNKYPRYDKGNYFSDGKTQIRFEPGKMIYENIALARKANNASVDDL